MLILRQQTWNHDGSKHTDQRTSTIGREHTAHCHVL